MRRGTILWISGCNSNAKQGRDGPFPGAVTTTDAERSTSIASASIFSTRGIDLRQAVALGSLLPMNSLAQKHPVEANS